MWRRQTELPRLSVIYRVLPRSVRGRRTSLWLGQFSLAAIVIIGFFLLTSVVFTEHGPRPRKRP